MSGGNQLEVQLNMYRTIQKEIAKVQSNISTAGTQILENEMVLKVRDRRRLRFPLAARSRGSLTPLLWLRCAFSLTTPMLPSHAPTLSPSPDRRPPCAQELDVLEDDAAVFKLIGPVLVRQELVEVKNNVGKRVEYIKNDIGRLEGNVKKFEKQQEEVKQEISKLQKAGGA